MFFDRIVFIKDQITNKQFAYEQTTENEKTTTVTEKKHSIIVTSPSIMDHTI